MFEIQQFIKVPFIMLLKYKTLRVISNKTPIIPPQILCINLNNGLDFNCNPEGQYVHSERRPVYLYLLGAVYVMHIEQISCVFSLKFNLLLTAGTNKIQWIGGIINCK